MIYVFINSFLFKFVKDYLLELEKYLLDCTLVETDSIAETIAFVKNNGIHNSTTIYCAFNLMESTNNNAVFQLNFEQYLKCHRENYIVYNQNYKGNNIEAFSENIPLLKSRGHEHVFHLPYVYNSSSYDTEYIKSTDVCIIGSDSERRRFIYDQLKNKYSVHFLCNEFDVVVKNNILKSCKLLINIHYSDSSIMFESIRCYPALFNRTIVLSEDSLIDDTIGINQCIILEKYENIIEKTVDILTNYEQYFTRANEVFNANIESYQAYQQSCCEKILSVCNQGVL